MTVADVARAAGVSEATVFNYFGSKEDLFFFRLESHGQRLIDAVAGRPDGVSVLDAFRGFLFGDTGGLVARVDAGDRRALDRLRTVNRVIGGSPTLIARESRSLSQTADALAAELQREPGSDDPKTRSEAAVVAHALIGVQRMLVAQVREIVLGGKGPVALTREVQAAGEAACALLSRGLASYGVSATSPRSR